MLDALRVLNLAGATVPLDGGGDPAPTEEQEAAVRFAEGIIRSYTGAEWLPKPTPPAELEPVEATIRVRLDARSYALPLPRDVRTVEDIRPAPDERFSPFLPRSRRLELVDEGSAELGAWERGSYFVDVTRGFEAGDDVEKAASLLAAYYLQLSDPERSSYASFAQGDMSGEWRGKSLPVPEAAVLLRRYRAESVEGSY